MFGDIYLCDFPFTSGVKRKLRPALVLFDLELDRIICRITSAVAAGPSDVVIEDWEAAGMLHPSCARLDRVLTAEKTLTLRRLGTLTLGDQDRVRRTWNTRMRLQP